jgi:hypothetical protein
MKLDAKIEYLTVPAVITGNHAELLATNGRNWTGKVSKMVPPGAA